MFSMSSKQWIKIGIGTVIPISMYFMAKMLSGTQSMKSASDMKHACITIPNPGGFDKLCITDAIYGCVGANVNGLKPGILKEDPTKMNSIKNGDFVMIEVHCIGINYADVCIRWGLYSSAKKYVGYPIIPGFEFSGKVIWKSNGNNRFNIGDEVFGVSLFGAYSTKLLVPGNQCYMKPKILKMDEAAGILATLFTAYHAVFNLSLPNRIPYIREGINDNIRKYYNNSDIKLEDENKLYVLIHSASGGVGSMLVQLCKHIAKIDCVIGVVGGKHKIKTAKELGCDYVINRYDIKHGKDIWDEIKYVLKDDNEFNGFDVIFDANGVRTLKKGYHNLRPIGSIVTYGFHTMLPHSQTFGRLNILDWIRMGINYIKTPSFSPLKLVGDNKSIYGFNLSFLFGNKYLMQSGMANVIPWIENGSIKVAKINKYKMENVKDAHRDIQSGNTVGKLVLTTPYFVE